MRQSSRAFASAPVRQLAARSDGVWTEPAVPPFTAWRRTNTTRITSPRPPPPTATGPPGKAIPPPAPRRSSICDVSSLTFFRKRTGSLCPGFRSRTFPCSPVRELEQFPDRVPVARGRRDAEACDDQLVDLRALDAARSRRVELAPDELVSLRRDVDLRKLADYDHPGL